MSNWIIGFDNAPQKYEIGGITYVVESSFKKANHKKTESNVLMNSRIKNYLSSDFADLTSLGSSDKMATEYVCSVAGKEE